MLYQMFALVMLTFAVGIVAFTHRFRAIRQRKMSIKYFRTMSGEPPPEGVAKSTRHFDNMFEVPTLFYAACLAAMVLNKTGPAMQALAWAFVIARFAQAFIHLTYNNVLHRMVSFVVGMGLMIALWVMLAIPM